MVPSKGLGLGYRVQSLNLCSSLAAFGTKKKSSVQLPDENQGIHRPSSESTGRREQLGSTEKGSNRSFNGLDLLSETRGRSNEVVPWKKLER